MTARWLGATVLAVSLTACAPGVPEVSSTPSGTPTATTSPSAATSATTPDRSPEPAAAQAPAGSALSGLTGLAITGRAPKTGYDRDLFGPAWADVDRNGCDTRNDVLARDLTGESFRPGTYDCVVVAGSLDDPYTGRTIIFSKSDANAVQIDHVVALSDAWQKGAQQWDADRRLAFANDPLNLLAVDGPANASKSDGDAATWLPPNTAYRCALVARQTAVKLSYQLSVTQAEHDAITRILTSCPDQPLPTGTQAPKAVSGPQQSVEDPEPTPPPTADGVDPNYGSCREAQANGAGPYVRGRDPEYAYYRDGDSDGTVCD